MRKLFAKAGITLANADQEIPLENVFSSNFGKIRYVVSNPMASNIGDSEYLIPQDASLKTIIYGFTDMRNDLAGRLFNLHNDSVPVSLALYNKNDQLVSNILLQNEHVTFYTMSTLMVQNRTKGATSGEDASTDRVDNQPLRGYLYEFKNATPKLRQHITTPNPPTSGLNDVPINRMSDIGISLVKGTNLPNDYNEPPVPKKWANLKAHSNVVLQPGNIRKAVISHKYSGRLGTLFKRMQCLTTTVDAIVRIYGGPGTSQLLGLEEIIRTDSGNPITLQYERELKIGCILKSKNKQVFTSQYFSGNVNA